MPSSTVCPSRRQRTERRSIDTFDPDFRSVHYAPHKRHSEAPRKYDSGDQVYDRGDLINGYPSRIRLWICCMRFNKRTREWWYRVKDGPLPYGRDIRWVSEGGLEYL